MNIEDLSRKAISEKVSVSEKVVEFTSEELEIPREDINLETPFEEFLSKAFHSIDFFCILQKIEDFFNISFSDNEVRNIEKVGELVAITELKINAV
ncbi:MAG TPA: acyl carrier protein [Candidatus Paceibacterota bacterium]|nr:acyl carrier protein [Candidatus Paceibacterota bacterium]